MIYRIRNRLFQVINTMFARIKLAFDDYSNFIDLMNYVQYNRIPQKMFNFCSKGVVKNGQFLASNAFYLRVLDNCLNITVSYSKRCVLNNMTSIGTSGLDIYKIVNNKYIWLGCYAPKCKNEMLYNFSVTDINNDLICIFLPAYAKISHLLINKTSFKFENYRNTNGDILFYGSSITQGCAASRPGLSYVNIFMTKYGYNIRNFGFSESAKGESSIITYIASLHYPIYVIEYDHNASYDELKKTHKRVYEIIRNYNPYSIIILFSRISGGVSISLDEEEIRSRIIQNTYMHAINLGDKKIGYIRGRDIVKNNVLLYLQDDRHPNDLGMKIIAEEIYKEICRLGE